MAYEVTKTGSRWNVTDGGTPVTDGEHATEAAAQAHVRSLEALQKTLDITGQPGNVFIPLVKVDEQRREVWGWGALEQPDHSDEIMDYSSSKPYWMEWSKSAQKRSGGKSFGNLRSMHKAIAAGRLISFQPDDAQKGFYVGANVVDDDEWNKVLAGVYTGFSVGGHYVRRWVDMSLGKTRYTAAPAEISLVDAPCIPGAVFSVVKADGLTEERSFNPTAGVNVLKGEIPDAPEATGDVDAEGETVEKIPLADQSMQVSPDNPPDGETLAGRHIGVQELLDLAGKIIQAGDIPGALDKIRAAAAELEKETTAADLPGVNMVPAEEEKPAEEEQPEADGDGKADDGEPEPEAVKKVRVSPRRQRLAKVRQPETRFIKVKPV